MLKDMIKESLLPVKRAYCVSVFRSCTVARKLYCQEFKQIYQFVFLEHINCNRLKPWGIIWLRACDGYD